MSFGREDPGDGVCWLSLTDMVGTQHITLAIISARQDVLISNNLLIYMHSFFIITGFLELKILKKCFLLSPYRYQVRLVKH